MIEVSGHTADGLESVRAVARRVAGEHRSGAFAFAAHHGGELVVDLWAGCARDALFHTWSVIKPVTGACLLHCVERAGGDLSTPVTDVWPRLRAVRGTGMTVRHVLGHAAGLVSVPGGDAGLLVDRDATFAALEAAVPDWPPGTAVGEHALTFGHLVDRLLLALGGRGVRRYLAEEFRSATGLDLWIGLPAEHAGRVVDTVGLDASFWLRGIGAPGSLRHRALGGGLPASLVNSVAWRSADVPAVNGYATTRAVAAFYDLWLRGDLPAMFAVPTESQQDLVLGRPVAWTLAGGQRHGSWVGMGGVGGQVAGADAELGATWAFLTSEMGTADRARTLVDELTSVLRGRP